MATPTETDEGGRREGAGGRPGGGGNVFTRKLGPLPLWAWMGIGLALALVLSLWSAGKKKASNEDNTTDADTSTSDNTADQTPPFIIQNYTTYPTTTSPPATPPATTTPGTPTTLPGKVTNPPPINAPKPPVVSKPTKSATPKPIAYKVKPGDTLSSIAKKYGTTVDKIWAYNTGTGKGTANRPASTIKTLKARGKNLLYANETIYIPPK